MEQEPHRNRLADAQSPYLLQHADNPVDWYPWGNEAFEKARRENKPVFLSVGYSTCHWCHVMAEESFADAETARLLNEHYVSIKLDREERPDVDRVYMTFVQATTGGGGWPMSVWLTPDLKPFYGGTYFPPENRWGQPSFKKVLCEIADAWKRDAAQISDGAADVLRQLRESMHSASAAVRLSERELLDAARHQFHAAFDSVHGGFGGAPKFPRPSVFVFLFRHYERTGHPEALHMALFSLKKMAEGGVCDHLGGGFHRYSVDAEWHVPHFEKMLYDQAQLVSAYLDAGQFSRDKLFEDTARSILDYVLRELRDSEGAFYSAEDADSPVPEHPERHSEGAFYLWTNEEISDALGVERAQVFAFHYGVTPHGNVRSDPHGMFEGKNIPAVHHSIEETASRFQRTAVDVEAILKDSRIKLFDRRSHRPRPHRDDKTLTAWNALMISAFARAYRVLGDPRYLEAARQAVSFIRHKLYDESSGILLRRFRAGRAGIEGYLDDYAFLVQALLDLNDAAAESGLLDWAMTLQRKQDALFADPQGAGYFSTAEKAPDIVLRIKEEYDGAEPSANSVAAMNLLRLAHGRGRADCSAGAVRILAAAAARLQHSPTAMPQMLAAMEYHLGRVENEGVAPVCGPDGCALPADQSSHSTTKQLRAPGQTS